jgi:hypothetical protein
LKNPKAVEITGLLALLWYTKTIGSKEKPAVLGVSEMYKKRDRGQMTIADFIPPFGGKLDAENRWVKMAKIMPWDMIEDAYAKSFKTETLDGRPPIPSRIAFGALYIKENENFPQERTLQHISENVYMQYFLGLTEFNPTPLFDSSMMTHFAKRFSKEDIARINEEIYRRTHQSEEDPPMGGGDDGGGSGDAGGEDETGNKGTLILDATVAPADIRYPTDLSLLNECRECTEKIIDDVWGKTDRKGHKTAYSRRKARKGYLKIAKQRKPRKNQIRAAIKEQLICVEKNILALDRMRDCISMEDYLKHHERLETIRSIAEQQRWHFENPGKPIPNRIVSVSQPHVRPIVRGKARSEVEFGQKLSLSIVDGYTFIESQRWDNFAEGGTLKASVEKYRGRHGAYPEAVLADKTYRNRKNINYCKSLGIRLSGPRLGRPKASEIEAGREQAYQDSCERNIVEGRIGINKRRYGLNLIYGKLEQTGEVEVAMNVLCMNVALVLRHFLRLLQGRLFLLLYRLLLLSVRNLTKIFGVCYLQCSNC